MKKKLDTKTLKTVAGGNIGWGWGGSWGHGGGWGHGGDKSKHRPGC